MARGCKGKKGGAFNCSSLLCVCGNCGKEGCANEGCSNQQFKKMVCISCKEPARKTAP